MATLAPAVRRIRDERIFYTGMALAILCAIVAGFSPSFYVKGMVAPYAPVAPLTPLVIVHGTIFSLWVLLFLVQTALISARRPDLHRTLGHWSIGLAVLMVALGLTTSAYAIHHFLSPPGISPLAWFAIPFWDMPVFATLVTLGLLNRNRAQHHKHFMLIAMIGLLPPALGRLPWPDAVPLAIKVFGFADLFLIPLVLWDLRSRGRVHPVTLGAGAFVIASDVFRLAIWNTAPWLAFAGWVGALTA